jgi:hypothetical protein
MTKSLLDIQDAVLTNHNRAQIVLTRHMETIRELSMLLMKASPENKAVVKKILEETVDVAEVMQGFLSSIVDIMEWMSADEMS